MSTAIVRAEIERFLRSPSPEVLCISGKWGVGKTYSWQTIFDLADIRGKQSFPRYAYVSLFGLNALSELRNAVVENTVTTESRSLPPNPASLYDMLRLGEKLLRNRPALELAAGFFRMKDAGDALYRAAFLAVRGQIICFDDLERAGESLKMRDILGLTSMLCEQRKCKVVLLLNSEQLDEEHGIELTRQLEKVVDTFLTFEPTSVEAADIAIIGNDQIAQTIRQRVVALSVTNIRVMKKIERWAQLVATELSEFDPETIVQATATVVLAGWCFLQRDLAPNLDYVRKFSSMSGLFGNKDDSDETKRWRTTLMEYGYQATDELDESIISGIAVGYFRGDELRTAAKSVQDRRKLESRNNSYSQAWELYHKNLMTDDDTILDALYSGAMENLSNIIPVNINSGVRLLRQYGRGTQASEIVVKYVETNRHKLAFFDRWSDFFANDPVDPELLEAMRAGRAAIIDARDPAEMLKQIVETNSFNPAEDATRLSSLTTDELVRLFDDNASGNLKGMIEWANRISDQPGAEALKLSLTNALDRIAARSPMRADRLRNWGVVLTVPEAGLASPDRATQYES